MTAANVELVRDAIAAWNRREADLWKRYAAADFEWIPAGPAAVETGVYHGHEEAARGVVSSLETFELFEFVGGDVLVRGDAALWLGRLRTRGGASGVELEREFALHFTIADGRFTRVRGHASWEEALRAAWPAQGATAAENEELVRWGYDWFNREREPPPTWHPDGEFINAREDPDHAAYRGIDAIRAQHAGWFEAYPDLHVEPLEIRANGNRVFVWTRFAGHGADSGAAMEMELAHVVTFEGAETRRMQEFFDRAEALAAAGLAR